LDRGARLDPPVRQNANFWQRYFNLAIGDVSSNSVLFTLVEHHLLLLRISTPQQERILNIDIVKTDL
jgi:hypothetical protein